LRWVRGAVGPEAAPDTSRTVGTAVHEVAQRVAEGLPPAEAPAVLDGELDTLDLGPGWADQRQRESAHDMLDRFLAWHGASRRELLAAEADFDVTLGRVRIRGQVDRLERDSEGRLVVVDLKTGKTPAKADDIGEHGQLAAYQVAVAAGGFPEHGHVPGGAALLQIGTGAKAKEQHQDPLPGDVEPAATWAGELLAEVGDGMGAATFEVRTGSHCDRCPMRRSCPLHERGGQVTR
jgi:RecB family exonuclease